MREKTDTKKIKKSGGKGEMLIFSSNYFKQPKKLVSALIALIFLFNSCIPSVWAREGNCGKTEPWESFAGGALVGLVTSVSCMYNPAAGLAGSIASDLAGLYMYYDHYDDYGETKWQFDLFGHEINISKGQVWSMAAGMCAGAAAGYGAGALGGAASGAASGASQSFVQTILNIVVGAVKEALRQVKEMIKHIIKGIFDLIKDLVQGFVNMIFHLFTGNILALVGDLVKMCVNVIKDVVRTVVRVIRSIIQLIKGIAQTIWKHAKEYIKSLWKSISTKFKSMWNSVKCAWKSITSGLKQIKEACRSMIKSIQQAWKEGIKQTIKNIGRKIKEGFKALGDKIKQSFKAVGDKLKTKPKEGYWSLPSTQSYDPWVALGKEGKTALAKQPLVHLGKVGLQLSKDLLRNSTKLCAQSAGEQILEDKGWDEETAKIAAGFIASQVEIVTEVLISNFVCSLSGWKLSNNGAFVSDKDAKDTLTQENKMGNDVGIKVAGSDGKERELTTKEVTNMEIEVGILNPQTGRVEETKKITVGELMGQGIKKVQKAPSQSANGTSSQTSQSPVKDAAGGSGAKTESSGGQTQKPGGVDLFMGHMIVETKDGYKVGNKMFPDRKSAEAESAKVLQAHYSSGVGSTQTKQALPNDSQSKSESNPQTGSVVTLNNRRQVVVLDGGNNLSLEALTDKALIKKVNDYVGILNSPAYQQYGPLMTDTKGNILSDMNAFSAVAAAIQNQGLSPLVSAAVKIGILSALRYETYYGRDSGEIYDNFWKMALADAGAGLSAGLMNNWDWLGSKYAGTLDNPWRTRPDDMGFLSYAGVELLKQSGGALSQIVLGNYCRNHDIDEPYIAGVVHLIGSTVSSAAIDAFLRRDPGLAMQREWQATEKIKFKDNDIDDETKTKEPFSDGKFHLSDLNKESGLKFKTKDGDRESLFNKQDLPLSDVSKLSFRFGDKPADQEGKDFVFDGKLHLGDIGRSDGLKFKLSPSLDAPATATSQLKLNLPYGSRVEVLEPKETYVKVGEQGYRDIFLNGRLSLGGTTYQAADGSIRTQKEIETEYSPSAGWVYDNDKDGKVNIYRGDEVITYKQLDSIDKAFITADRFVNCTVEDFNNNFLQSLLNVAPFPYNFRSPGTGLNAIQGAWQPQQRFIDHVDAMMQGVNPIQAMANQLGPAMISVAADNFGESFGYGIANHLWLPYKQRSFVTFIPTAEIMAEKAREERQEAKRLEEKKKEALKELKAAIITVEGDKELDQIAKDIKELKKSPQLTLSQDVQKNEGLSLPVELELDKDKRPEPLTLELSLDDVQKSKDLTLPVELKLDRQAEQSTLNQDYTQKSKDSPLPVVLKVRSEIDKKSDEIAQTYVNKINDPSLPVREVYPSFASRERGRITSEEKARRDLKDVNIALEAQGYRQEFMSFEEVEALNLNQQYPYIKFTNSDGDTRIYKV
ncbi:MAG: hypothetical protein V2A64_03855, partial [Candidatus Omnitrophota bacterium]